jgi:hypothetical protein
MGPMPGRNGCLYTATVRRYARLGPARTTRQGMRQRPTVNPSAQTPNVSSTSNLDDVSVEWWTL